MRKARFSSDGKLIAAATPEGRTYVWEKNASKPTHVFLQHENISDRPSPGDYINDIAFSPGKPEYLVSTSLKSHQVKIWNIETGDLIKSIDHQGR